MKIFPAIDLYNGSAVRLLKGDYAQMTVYNRDPVQVAHAFEEEGASCLHLVDLEGAKTGETPNLEAIRSIVSQTKLFTELGGGIRSLETMDAYLNIGVGRVILGTAAVMQPELVRAAVRRFGNRVAVGVDFRAGAVAIHGWRENSAENGADFCLRMQEEGVETLIVTDISRDGAMKGTNRTLYRQLSSELSVKLIASGGVSTLDDVRALRAMNLHGAIIGKAYYTGAVELSEAIEVAK